MQDRQWQVGVCGTFDVANYGDLLFPLIAEAELTQRLGSVLLHRFSYGARTPPEWPYAVTSVAQLPEFVDRLDGLLIGGGFLIRFDKQVAPGYGPPNPEVHHPTGYWLTPALIALQHDVPVVWNAPGMHCNEIPEWAGPLVERALSLSRYVSVRDEPSRSALSALTDAPVAVVPDTGFGILRLLDLDSTPSPEYSSLRRALGLEEPYIVVQATLGLEGFVRFVKQHAPVFQGHRFVALPIGPALGEDTAIIDADLPRLVRVPDWPGPLLIAELIARSEAVVGHSYHLCVTALAAGVPVFTGQDLSSGKYTALQHFESIFPLPSDGSIDPYWFLARVGRNARSDAVCAADRTLRDHWDRIATVLREPRVPTSPSLDRFWQALPGLLEHTALRDAAADVALAELAATQSRLKTAMHDLDEAGRASAAADVRLAEVVALLADARDETAARERQLAAMRASTSWTITTPVRFIGRRLRRSGGERS
jgi:lipopolysaccharide transport system ATP-binding protein